MRHILVDFQKKALSILSGKIDDFYLGGGTALALYYFNHRESFDLDLFTLNFNRVRIFEVIKLLAGASGKKATMVAQQVRKNKLRMYIYTLRIDAKHSLKIDFIEDYLECIKPPKSVNGIRVLSLDDIYLRKIFAVSGTSAAEDSTGRPIMLGGRQEAKDFYDLYCLSRIFMPLSDFVYRFGNPLIREALIRWFRTYGRMEIKTGLLELRLKKEVDYADMERHFKKEIGRIMEKEVESL